MLSGVLLRLGLLLSNCLGRFCLSKASFRDPGRLPEPIGECKWESRNHDFST